MAICVLLCTAISAIAEDNLVYDHGLEDSTRAVVEEHGRAEVDGPAAALLAWTRRVHFWAVTVVVPVMVVLRSFGNEGLETLGRLLPFLLWTAAAAAESQVEARGRPAGVRCFAFLGALGRGDPAARKCCNQHFFILPRLSGKTNLPFEEP